MTLKNNRAPLLCCFKLCASFHSHWWIQPGVTAVNALRILQRWSFGPAIIERWLVLTISDRTENVMITEVQNRFEKDNFWFKKTLFCCDFVFSISQRSYWCASCSSHTQICPVQILCPCICPGNTGRTLKQDSHRQSPPSATASRPSSGTGRSGACVSFHMPVSFQQAVSPPEPSV